MTVRVRGRVAVHPRGFGFLQLDSPQTGSAFIAPPDLNPLLADDLVSATVTAGADGRLTASDLQLVERPRGLLFGEVIQRRGQPHLRVDREVTNTDWPLGDDAPQGGHALFRVTPAGLRLARALGADDDLSLWQIVARHGLGVDFPATALAEAAALAERPHELGHRRDLRAVPTITVDAASTRDIDDAISVLPPDPGGGLRVLVSIADVAAYVTAGGPLDQAARERGTSVYLAGQVLPMLPEALSTGALSLHPGVPRSALTAELRLSPEGEVVAVDVYESLLCSRARVTYDELAAWLEGSALCASLATVADMLPLLRAATARLQVARERRGGVVMHSEDARVVLDERGAPTAVAVTAPTPAHKLIELFMVAANEAVARWLSDRGAPALYRVHDQPEPDDVADLAAAARRFGFTAAFGPRLTPLALRAFDVQIAGSPAEPALRSVLRRRLGPARYQVAPAPHFGLAAPLYLHFTSPIRRYADLCVHRVVKRYLRGERDLAADEADLRACAPALNRAGRAAGRAENDRHRVLVARYLKDRIGEVHDAHLTRVRPFGLLAQIDATLAEGMIPLESLRGGPYRVDPRETEATGADRTFAVGQPVRVRVTGADPLLGRVEFSLVE